MSHSMQRQIIQLWYGGASRRGIARMLGISRKTVERVLVDHENRMAGAPEMGRVGRAPRPNLLDDFAGDLTELVERNPGISAVRLHKELRIRGFKGGYTIVRARLRAVRPLPQKRQELFDWMRAVLQGAVPRATLKEELGHVAELDKLVTAILEGRLSHRNKALAVLARERGIGQSYVRSFLYISKGAASSYWKCFKNGGTTQLFGQKERSKKRCEDEDLKRAVFALLHEPPSTHGINRTSWKLADLKMVLRSQGQVVCPEVIRTIIKKAGYKWRKARTVLTSKDPHYKAKLEAVQDTLSKLENDEAFFSIDEFGPFAVKKRGGKKRVAPAESYTVPQWQRSKGYLIVTAALELSRNLVTHFYSKKKNTAEMIKLMELLREQYRACKTIYLSWDAASWHISRALFSKIRQLNEQAASLGYPVVKTAPLPAGAQFLNVIESVFSGLARGVIHNSDYPSLEAAERSIDEYFEARNQYFREHPRRAGRKIWGLERVESEFRESNNCKDPLFG
jgi:transposase